MAVVALGPVLTRLTGRVLSDRPAPPHGRRKPASGSTSRRSAHASTHALHPMQRLGSPEDVAEAVLSRRPGVVSVDANPVSQTATVTYDFVLDPA